MYEPCLFQGVFSVLDGILGGGFLLRFFRWGMEAELRALGAGTTATACPWPHIRARTDTPLSLFGFFSQAWHWHWYWHWALRCPAMYCSRRSEGRRHWGGWESETEWEWEWESTGRESLVGKYRGGSRGGTSPHIKSKRLAHPLFHHWRTGQLKRKTRRSGLDRPVSPVLLTKWGQVTTASVSVLTGEHTISTYS
jgi:hypothetical protein